MNQEKQMTEEEMKKMMEVRKAEWDTFIGKIKDDPSAVVTNAVLEKTIDFLAEDMGGIAQMAHALSQNMNVLNNNFAQIMTAIQGGPQTPGVNKTKSGIILP